MTSGRVVAEAALKPALIAAGWRARAAGWFTKEMAPGTMAVLAVGVASKHHVAGQAALTIYVGLRDEGTERIVEQVAGARAPRYQHRTWVTPLGYLLPDSGFRQGEREIDGRNAAQVANELAGLIAKHAEPRLREIAAAPSKLTRLANDSVSSSGLDGLCRIAALLARTQGMAAAVAYIDHRVAALRDRTDTAADLERHAAPRVLAALEAAYLHPDPTSVSGVQMRPSRGGVTHLCGIAERGASVRFNGGRDV